MLKRLKYSVTFPSTGRTLEADVEFSKGFTAITGPNEAGKSMIFEMSRFLLFGADALRGPMDDYKSLRAEGEFVIRDNVVEITRTHNKASMKRNGEVVATGTKPVNLKVLEELGFGLGVFDVACSINQGEVERLGEMRPAQRKQMVDSVLGLAALDNVAKWAAEEARLLDRQASSLRERLTPPGVVPAAPDGYRSISEEELERARAEAEELAGISGWLSVEKTKPARPTCKIDLPAANLRQFAQKRAAVRETVASLEARVRGLPEKAPYDEPTLAIAEAGWPAYHTYEAARRWLAQNPRPKWVSVTQLQVFKDDYVARDNIERRATLARQIEALAAKGSKPCPHCGGEIPLEEDAITELEAKHDAIEVPHDGFVPDQPPLEYHEIDRAIAQLRAFDEAKFKEMSAVPERAQPEIAEHEIPKFRAMLNQVAERAELQQHLDRARADFEKMPDYEGMLVEREAYERALEAYLIESRDYDAWATEKLQKLQRAAVLKGAGETYTVLRADAAAFRVYEAERRRWGEVKAAYDTGLEAISKIEADAEEHRKVREVMAVLRGLIKQHVLPSLNVVSSHLLRQMTGGQRYRIHIDDDFNVQVDQQALETLSGSGKACANLAIRIALGQVLTNRVISLLLADEIDASMDSFRAEKTSNVLRILEDNISQVLLVSHKPVEAPHHVRLGGDSADDEYDFAG